MILSLNYFLEANLALCLYLAVYICLFRNETSFRFKRIILLSGIAISLLFPVLHISGSPLQLPTFAQVIPARMLPEFVVVGNPENNASIIPSITLPQMISYVYWSGAAVALFVFLIRMYMLAVFILRSQKKRIGNLYVAESPYQSAPFSFFNFIFIGQVDHLTDREKQLIMSHESVHVRCLHTLDIILIEMLRVFFWFNPALKIYKNIFIQLHEFEADARSVRTEEMGDYCNLMARVALLSADIRIANHFSNSLTLKRIQMMRTIKSKVRPWKVATISMMIPAFFVLLSCQDQLGNEVSGLAQNSTMAIDVPDEVQLKYDELKNAHPELKLILMELSETQEDYSKLEKIQNDIEKKGKIMSVNLITPTVKDAEPLRHFMIIEYNDKVSAIAERTLQDNVYTVVEESATPAGGIPGFYGFLSQNISYPKEAREKGLQGKVFVSFIVETDGALSDLQVSKGVSTDLDAEAIRVLKLSPRWIPAKNKGAIVRQRMVLPINFMLDQQKEKKVGSFSTPINPLEFLHPDNQHKC